MEKALTALHEQFNLYIPEYIIEAVRDDLLCSWDPGNDTVLNRVIRANREKALTVLKEES